MLWEHRFVLSDLLPTQIDEPSQFAEGERPRPQGSSPVEEYPETEKYSDSDIEVQSTNIPLCEKDTRERGNRTKTMNQRTS